MYSFSALFIRGISIRSKYSFQITHRVRNKNYYSCAWTSGGIGKKNWKGRMNMANKIVRDELKSRGVRHWELAHELGVSEQTLVRWLRFELDEDRQLDMLEKIEEIVKEKETLLSIKEKNEIIAAVTALLEKMIPVEVEPAPIL